MRWTLRGKILMGYGLVLALMVLVSLWALHNLRVLGRASDAILRENYKSIIAAENMIDAIERQDSATLLLLLGDRDTARRQFRENESQFLQWLGRARDNITIDGEAEIVDEISAANTRYLVLFSELDSQAQSSRSGRVSYHNRILPAFQEVRDACAQLRDLNEQTMAGASRQASRVAAGAMLSVAIMATTAVTVGLVWSLLLSGLLTRPLNQMLQATGEIAEGRYGVRVRAASADELGKLASGFNRMAQQLAHYYDMNVEEVMAEKRKSDALVRSIDDGVIFVNSQFLIEKINPAATRILETEPQEALGRHFLETVKHEGLFGYVRRAAETGEAPRIPGHDDVLSVGDEAHRRWYQVAVTPVRVGREVVLGVVVLLRDVTELTDLDRMKTEFLMKASHELRTPLAGIGMSISLLLESPEADLSSANRELLQAAHEETERLKALVNDLLDLSKIEAGRIDLEFDAVPVNVLFAKATGVLQVQADERSVELSAQVGDEVPNVKVDPNKITWVLTNLIANALRYTEAGGHIVLRAADIGSQVEISVADDGRGIPPEYQSRIFDKFVQVSTDTSPGGTGLGLAICREVVRAHGGAIWVQSAPGEGSTFSFTLPVA